MSSQKCTSIAVSLSGPVMDPGFARRGKGVSTRKVRASFLSFWPIFLENYMGMKKKIPGIFTHVWLSPTSHGLNLISRKLHNESVK